MSTNSPRLISDRLEADLDRQICGLQREVRLLTLAGITLLVGLLCYFSFVVNIVQHEMRPKDLAKVSSAFISDFLVSTVREYGDNLIRLAPDYTGNILDSAVVQMMGLSKETRYLVVGWLAERMDHIERMLVQLLDHSYEQHIDDLKLLLTDITSPKGAKAFEEYFAQLLTGPLASETIKLDIESLDLTLQSLNERMAKLSRDEGLSPTDRTERDLLLACREYWERLQKH